MTNPPAFQYTRTIVSFMAILLVFLIVADMFIVSNQREQLFKEVQNHMQFELDLIGTFVREPLLKHDYATVEQFLMHWAKEHKDVVDLKAVMPNNFVIAEYSRTTRSRYVYALQKQVRQGEKDLINLKVVRDFSNIESILGRLRLQLIVISLFLLATLGILLWRIVRTMALKPLEREINLRTQVEEKLQKAKDQLEARVQERTAELKATNQSLLMEIAEREKIEETLKEREQRLQTIIETEPECVKILAPDESLVTMNPAGLAMIEADSLEQVVGQKLSSLISPEYRDAFRDLNKRVLRGNKGSIEFEVIGLKGTRRWLETHAVPLRDAKNEIVGLLGVTRDITESKNAIKAIRLSEEKFSKAFRSSPAFVTISTVHDGRFIEVNDAFLAASGYCREEMLGRSSVELGIWTDMSDRNKMVEELKEHGVVYNKESRFRMKTGEILNVLYSAELIEIDGVQCIIAAILNITERKKLENQLFQAQKMEAVGQLAGGVAHDFNNIITAIFSYGYLTRNRMKEDDPLRDNIDKILSLSERAAQITRGLLTFSRMQHFEFVPVRLNEIIRNIEGMLVNFIGEDIEVRTKLSDEDITIVADRTQIEQVILNLATNARDAMPDGGRLNIETELAEMTDGFIKAHGFGEPGMYALLSVTDAGVGMDEETRRRVFEPFFTTKEVGKGTGLGLSVVYGIIKQHNGYVNIYSEPGKGTTFRIYLPEIKASIEREKEKMLVQKTVTSATILVAEDEPAVRDSIKNILQEFGYNVIEAVDGQDAVDKFAAHKDEIQLLLLDVVMPKKNGKEAHEEIRRMKPGIKAIFTSGYTADVMLRKKVLEEDVIFVAKPILPDKLLSKIREVIESER
ncbi:MAG TPA: hypothetical protein DDX85_10405 [Nitrospiraceae bacterium]|nr:hypothetical protein [Nitrospiraceae bacterium]